MSQSRATRVPKWMCSSPVTSIAPEVNGCSRSRASWSCRQLNRCDTETPPSHYPSSRPLNVRFGSLADITARSRHVRFTPDSGHSSASWPCPLASDSPTVRNLPAILFPSGEMMMKACSIAVAVVLALTASGCGSRQQAIAEAKSGSGTVPKTRLIMATLN